MIVEGEAEIVEDATLLKKVFAAYQKKYKMDVSGMGEPVFRVRPRVVFGLFEKKFSQTATRWLFPADFSSETQIKTLSEKTQRPQRKPL